MRVGLVRGLSVVFFILLASLAEAREQLPGWTLAGDWHIRATGEDKGCFALTSTVRNTTSFTLGYNRYAKQFVVMTADDRWGIEAKKSYDVRLSFDKSPPTSLRMRGDIESGDATLMWEGNELQPFLRGLSENTTLHLDLQGKRVASFSLNGIDQVLKNVLACHDTMIGRPASPQPGTGSAREGERERIQRWKDVGAWSVDFDPGMPGCVARLANGTNELRVGATGKGSFYVALRDKAWNWIKDGEDYDISFVAEGRKIAPLVLMGINRGDSSRPVLLEEFTREELDKIILRLVDAGAVTVQLGNRQLARYSTGDLALAMRELHDCERAKMRAAVKDDEDDQEPVLWKVVGGWRIVSRPTICMGIKEQTDPDETSMMIGRERKDASHMVVWINPAWNWIKHKAKYELVLHFKPGGPVKFEAFGAFDSGNALGITGSASLFDTIRVQNAVSIEYEGRRIGAVTLPNFELAARELRACIDAPYTPARTGDGKR